ncbi:MAG: methyltransferase domain-containing protein, partial [Gemmataceae bacterium]
MGYGQESRTAPIHHIEDVPDHWLKPAIFLASAAALYIEMVMVRWHATCFHAFAIFKNVSLLSCFLGLGIGFGTARYRRMSLTSFLPLLALQTVLFGALSCTNLGGRNINPIAEQLIMGKQRESLQWLHAIEGNVFLAIVFVINAWTFIPLGNLVGRLMARMDKVPAYSLNLLGSLTGIAVFFVLSLLWTGPEIWLGLAVLCIVPFLRAGRRFSAIAAGSLALMLISLGVLSATNGLTYYSPYQVIALRMPEQERGREAPSIQVNHAYYQDILDCSVNKKDATARRRGAIDYYNLPYTLQKNPGDVLVVGSGTGNDVAAALRNGAATVTGVELDPAILRIGKQLHPEQPYQDPRTRAVVNDARTYLRHTDESFDTIIYGLLDSHTNLGAMSNVRVDSFVYTLEGFQEALARLKPEGMLIVSYTILDGHQGERLYAMLRAAYPQQPPRAFLSPNSHDGGTTFVTGPGLAKLPTDVGDAREVTRIYQQVTTRADLATDDWPF